MFVNVGIRAWQPLHIKKELWSERSALLDLGNFVEKKTAVSSG